ncbi:MAG: hypothetical protein ABW082_13165 [Sedimenticola sp.]
MSKMKNGYLFKTLSMMTLPLALSTTTALAQDCGDVFNTPGRVGPWSYTDPFNWTKASMPGSKFKSRIHVVESAHFTSKVRNLVSGNTSAEPLGDISYTLEVIPNHPQALFAVIRLSQKTKGSMLYNPGNTSRKYLARQRNAECWFKRAVDFDPDSPTVHMLHGIYQYKKGNYKKSEQAYRISEKIHIDRDTESPELYYNMGLLFHKKGDIASAKVYADKAYSKNYPLPGLKRLLSE